MNALVQGAQTMTDTLAVCDSVSKAVAERSELLSSVTKKLETGELNSCISRGCVRSLQNVLVTLVKHASLLLKDVMLRLDVWSDVHAHDFRLQVLLHSDAIYSSLGCCAVWAILQAELNGIHHTMTMLLCSVRLNRADGGIQQQYFQSLDLSTTKYAGGGSPAPPDSSAEQDGRSAWTSATS